MNHNKRKIKSRTMTAFNRYNSIMQRAAEIEVPFYDGMQWYENGHEFLRDLSHESPFSVKRLAGVTALLSPLTTWNRNLNGTRVLVESYKRGLPKDWMFFIASRYTAYNANSRKAVEFLHNPNATLDDISGMKVKPFAFNLSGDYSHVTIDRHMWKAVDKFGLSSRSPTGNAQTALKRAIKMCASRWDIKPAQCQAIVWVTWRDFLN